MADHVYNTGSNFPKDSVDRSATNITKRALLMGAPAAAALVALPKPSLALPAPAIIVPSYEEKIYSSMREITDILTEHTGYAKGWMAMDLGVINMVSGNPIPAEWAQIKRRVWEERE